MDASHGLRPLFAPRSVAVIGASRREGSIGRAILANLRGHGFAGTLYAVNPRADVIDGVPCVASITQLRVDLAVVAVPAGCVQRRGGSASRASSRSAIAWTSRATTSSSTGPRIPASRSPVPARFRGSPIADRAALGSALQRLASVTEIAPELAELELNPLLRRAP